MEFILNRYRNVTVLLLVLTAQMVLIAYQVKTSKDVPLIRVWAVNIVTPVEKTLDFVRRNTWGLVEDYFVLIHVREENGKLKKEVSDLKLNNHYLRAELSTADRARALMAFQEHTPSKTIAARILGNGTGANSKVVFVDRGAGAGVESGMAVVTADGIVGKVVAAYPTSSLVLLITDVNFAAGVVSQKNRVHGTLKGTGRDGSALVDYIQNEEKVEAGEWFYTSGDDRIFPRGFPVGQVTAVRNGPRFKEVFVSPSGFQASLDEILIVLEAVHQPIPDVQMASPNYKLTPPPPGAPLNSDASAAPGPGTEADRLKEQYKQVQHSYGAVGSPVPDFAKLPGSTEPKPAAPITAANPAAPQAVPPPLKPRTDENGTASSEQSKPKPPAADPQNAGSQPSSAPRPKAKAPILVTDPTDADPSEPVISAPPPSKPKPKNQPLLPRE